ncbi:MAG: hypothetical protein WA895_04595 [Streptosporangiaceae bacterium]
MTADLGEMLYKRCLSADGYDTRPTRSQLAMSAAYVWDDGRQG